MKIAFEHFINGNVKYDHTIFSMFIKLRNFYCIDLSLLTISNSCQCQFILTPRASTSLHPMSKCILLQIFNQNTNVRIRYPTHPSSSQFQNASQRHSLMMLLLATNVLLENQTLNVKQKLVMECMTNFKESLLVSLPPNIIQILFGGSTSDR